MEHNAVMRPLIQSGIAFTRIPADRQGHMIVKGIEELILPTTKAILVTAASNVSGTVQPLQALSDIARTHHLLFLVDTAQAVPYLDLSGLTADAFAWTGHKGLLGPQGVGGLVLSPQLAEMINPLVSGGTGSFSDKETIPTVMPDKLEAGTQNLPGILGLGTALSFLAAQKTKLRENERDMGSLQLEGLLSIKKISLAGPPSMEGRVPVFSIDVPDGDNADIAFTLSSRYGIETRVGLHCAPAAHKSLMTFPKGTIRFSPGPFTTKDDIRTTLEALKEILDA
jgi:selenocysteine lyase/cysteine desulfurase